MGLSLLGVATFRRLDRTGNRLKSLIVAILLFMFIHHHRWQQILKIFLDFKVQTRPIGSYYKSKYV